MILAYPTVASSNVAQTSHADISEKQGYMQRGYENVAGDCVCASDTDTDNDGIGDEVMRAPMVKAARGDHDSDGCKDGSEDQDDDNDGIPPDDDCLWAEIGWTANNDTDHDNDGCRDSTEDTDDDADGSDASDSCVKGQTNWTSNETDRDGDGCHNNEDDDDNDGVADNADACARGQVNWLSDTTTDYDSDGCKDGDPSQKTMMMTMMVF